MQVAFGLITGVTEYTHRSQGELSLLVYSQI